MTDINAIPIAIEKVIVVFEYVAKNRNKNEKARITLILYVKMYFASIKKSSKTCFGGFRILRLFSLIFFNKFVLFFNVLRFIKQK